LTEYVTVEAILCSQAEAGKMLAIGKTKLGELIAQGELQSVRIGTRRLVTIASVRLLAGAEMERGGETE
jgi:excisionase family DNA binding protein